MTRTLIKVPLQFLALEDDTPIFLPLIADFIKKHAKTKGVFRIPGNEKTVMDLNEQLAQHTPRISSQATVYDVISFLKLWLKSLPTPLIPPDVFNKYMSPNDPTYPITVIKHLNPIARHCFAIIISIIHAVVQESQTNQMPFGSLSICFLTSLTQNNSGLKAWFPLKVFYDSLLPFVNEDLNDFELNNVPIPRSRGSHKQRFSKSSGFLVSPISNLSTGQILLEA